MIKREQRTKSGLTELGLDVSSQSDVAITSAPLPLGNQRWQPVINAGEKVLEFDWPTLQIGTGEYQEGPTGVTVFRFGDRALGTVDVRGGAPGTVNTDYLRLGYERPQLDAVVFSGGSWYGLECTTAVATALKDENVRNGLWDDVALSVGAIVYDLGDKRLNEVYPDKTLAQAAFRAARPGKFPLGAHGAGRNTRSGGFFGCAAYSGQGGAFRQIGDIKVAAFAVVNSAGVVTNRNGEIVAGYRDPKWPKSVKTADLLAGVPASRKLGLNGVPEGSDYSNTTNSLVVTNQKLTHAELQRLAVQVHTSMARAIQPFATIGDGDVLYAVSTGEVVGEQDSNIAPSVFGGMNVGDLSAIASELMWDAILASVPDQPQAAEPSKSEHPQAKELEAYAGSYDFSPFVTLQISLRDDRLFALATGERAAYAIGKEEPVELRPVAAGQFVVPGRYPLTLTFEAPDRLIVNPGHWQQTGSRRAGEAAGDCWVKALRRSESAA
ncbi:P1 family peptidase [Sinorhizobium fredii]|uniref:DmpA family peptidase protein n=1 Tax=Rhizobium fredii TaxID=380 RepID=A0A2L0HBT6_RHIFR|nr:P1 family peptidase [Sinorhizobium fredii]AUX78925.1 DmpA family peptidase protein [Sinorhizobium fredii]